MTLKEKVTDVFQTRYGEAPATVIHAPARVNLIGGHTDYNGGYTLMCNVNRFVAVALRAREDGQVMLYDADHDETFQFGLTQFDKPHANIPAYLTGAAWVLGEHEHALRGWEGVIMSDIPEGIDMGQDAARLLTFLRAFSWVSGIYFEGRDLAKMADEAQRNWLGRRSMMADVLCITHAQANQALLVDLHTRQIEAIDLPESAGLAMLRIPDNIDQEAIDDLIPQRAEECRQAASAYKVGHLRDLSMSRFEKDAEDTEDVILQRARHILTENGRVILAGEMFRSEALATVGRLMTDSHNSLGQQFGIDNSAFDTLMACIDKQSNVFGARWCGMGNGVIALVRDFSVETFSKLVSICYKKETSKEIDMLLLQRVDAMPLD